MNDYYYIFAPFSFNGLHKKLSYTQYIQESQKMCAGNFWKVLKKDYSAIEKSLKGVFLKDKTAFIFNRLHTAGKTARI